VASYARQLIRSGEGQRAEAVLRRALNREWNPDLIRLYGVTETKHIADQIKLLESWGKKHVDDPDLMFAMAKLYRRDNQLESARELLTSVVTATGDSEAIAELGDLLEQMGEHESALLTYKQGLKALAGASAISAVVPSTESRLVALDVDNADAEIDGTLPVVSDANPA
jgi:HemY protein